MFQPYEIDAPLFELRTQFDWGQLPVLHRHHLSKNWLRSTIPHTGTLEHGDPIDAAFLLLRLRLRIKFLETSSISTRRKLSCVPSGRKRKPPVSILFPPCTVHNAIFNLMMHGKSVIEAGDYNTTKSGVDTLDKLVRMCVRFEKELIPSMASSCVFHIALVNWLLFTWRI